MNFLKEIEGHLDLGPAECAEIIWELGSHYRELEEELAASGMSECEAAREAARILGHPQIIASQLQMVHCQATWKSTLLSTFPFAVFLFIIGVWLIAEFLWHNARWVHITFNLSILLFSVLLIYRGICELEVGRRPIWLLTWFPVGMILLYSATSCIILAASPGILPRSWMNQLPVTPCGGITSGLIGLLCVLMTAAIAILAYRRSPIWICLIVLLSIASLWSLLGGNSFLRGTFFFILWNLVVVVIAFRLSSRQSRINSAQAALFLFVFYMFALFGSTAYARLGVSGSIRNYEFLLILLFMSAGVVFHSRAPRQRLKLNILAAAILATAMPYMVVGARMKGGMLYWSVVSAIGVTFLVLLTILMPLLFERFQWKLRNKLASSVSMK